MATTPRAYTWREAELINSSADETGATFHFYDANAEMIYLNSGLKYKYGLVPDGHWEDLELSDEQMLESTGYIFLKSDHPATGSLYIIALDRGTKDTLYLFRYDYERDVSELVEAATLTLQSDNPIAQISANIKNVKDSLFIVESSLFTPTAKMQLGIGYGKSPVYLLATAYMDEVEWKHGARTVSISGRNAVGYFLNSQTFDEDKSYKGTAVAILTEIFDRFGIMVYEIDDSDSKEITFDVSANDTGLKAVQIVSDLMTDILATPAKIWDIEELYDGTIIAGFDEFRGEYNPKGNYVFHGKSDVFARKINRSIDGSYSHVRVTGTDKSGHDLTPSIKAIETWDYWKPATHRTYHASKVDGLKDSSELEKYGNILAEQLRKSGQTVNYQTTLKPQLLVGDVAQIQGEEGEDNETLGIITEIKHSFGVKGYLTEFTAASGGIINTIGNKTYTKKKGVNGTDRSRRLSDFIGNTEIPTQESNNPVEPQPYITKYTFAHFDGSGHIELPISVKDLTADIQFAVEFELDSEADDIAVFGNAGGNVYAHLATTASGWSTSSGIAIQTFTAPKSGEEGFIQNHSGDNCMYYNNMTRHVVGAYAPTTVDFNLWLGGCQGLGNFVGKIMAARLKNSSTNEVLYEFYPARYFNADGTVRGEGIYDSVHQQFYTCEGLTVDKPYVKKYGYAHFAGSGHVELPIQISSFYEIEIWFKDDELLSGMAVFGNSGGNTHANLTKGQASGAWITSRGAEMTSFTISNTNHHLMFTNNYNDKNWMLYDSDNHEVTDYIPVASSYYLWIGGCQGQSNFIGDIERFLIIDLRDNSTVADIIPAEGYSGDGVLQNAGLYDRRNKKWYTCTGLTLHD